MSNALVFLDESGDLGWIFDQPYRAGGSSRFFTIAAAFGVNNDHRKIGKVIEKIRHQRNWTSKNEKKWKNISQEAKIEFAQRAAGLLKNNHNIRALAAFIRKDRIPIHMHGHHHLLYSWIVSSLISPSIRVFNSVSICPDELNAGIGNDNLLENTIRKEVWFNLRSSSKINRIPRTAVLEDGLAFCDYLAGAVQSHFEDGCSEPYNILEKNIFLHFPWH